MRYRSEFCRTQGLVLLDESETEVLLGYWKTPPENLVRCLEIAHGKRLVLRHIDEMSPEAMIALRPESAASTPEEDSADDRIHNLTPVEEYLRNVLEYAVSTGSTDISVWPWERQRWNVSVRRGGQMCSLGVLDQTFAEGLIRRLLHKAQLDVLDRISPQDGTITFPWLPEQRIRVSVVGDIQGQYLALRLLGRSVPTLPALGYGKTAATRLRNASSHRDGLILFAGPTGSGKTTGMAALLGEIAGLNRKVLSLEDPVEYRVPGVVQIERSTEQLNGEVIAAALRQDPDVLAFGEIRRPDHVRQLEEAILSGHLVVSSIHSSHREGTLNRLMTLGMSGDIARGYCRALCCQRLTGDPLVLEARVEEHPWN